MNQLTIDELETLTPDQLVKLLLAAVQRSYPDIQYITDILDVGCPINYRYTKEWTALHWAASSEHHEVVRLLLSRGADINARDEWGRTPWDIAFYRIHGLFPELKP